MKKIIFCLAIFLFSKASFVSGQESKSTKKIFQSADDLLYDAEYFFGEGDYLKALPLYVQLSERHSKDAYYKFQSGICYLSTSNEKEKALLFLEEAEKLNPKIKDLNFYLGRAYHLNYKFTEAIQHFNQFLNEKAPIEKKKLASHYIEQCKNAEVLVNEKIKVNIENIGPSINTVNSEYIPLISSDAAVLIYTYRGDRSTGGLMDKDLNPDPDGDYYEDIFISQRVGNDWLYPESIGENINTKGHDACIALSSDGQTLLLYKSTPKDKGDIYISKLNGDIWSSPERLGPNINTKYWEGSASISGDEQRLYFSSERPGGFGGKDLYVSTRMENGEWGKAVNLGPKINTPFDEDAPFIHPDGISLYFSSEGHNSLGGYDIMYSTVKTEEGWTNPVNLGYPLNTPSDERFYVLSADGETGYFSSGRKGGYGQQDIYKVSSKVSEENHILALVVGIVKVDEKPASAKINVTNAETGEKSGSFHSNSVTGKYLIALPPGNNYKIAIEVDNMPPREEYINTKTLDTYVRIEEDIPFYTKEYKEENGIETPDSTDTLQKKIEEKIKTIKEEKIPEVYEAKVFQQLLKTHGEEQKENVTYTVELGTYQNASDFDNSGISDLGNITSKTDSAGNTTFSMGNFKTLLDAEIFKYKLQKKDSSLTNTSITVNDNGERKILQQYYAAQYSNKHYTPPSEPKVITSEANNVKAIETKTVEPSPLITDAKKTKESKDSNVIASTVKTVPGEPLKETKEEIALAKEKETKLKKNKAIEPRSSTSPITSITKEEQGEKKKANKIASTILPASKESAIKTTEQNPIATKERKEVSPVFIEEPETPCNPDQSLDFAFFIGKDLNDTAIYNKLMLIGGNLCVEGLTFKVQIGAYRHPKNFKYAHLKEFEPAEIIDYPDGITRFTMKEFRTLKDAEILRQKIIKKGTKDAWITAVYQGKRMLLTELIAVNFYNKAIN